MSVSPFGKGQKSTGNPCAFLYLCDRRSPCVISIYVDHHRMCNGSDAWALRPGCTHNLCRNQVTNMKKLKGLILRFVEGRQVMVPIIMPDGKAALVKLPAIYAQELIKASR
jgi:hypothetical protein